VQISFRDLNQQFNDIQKLVSVDSPSRIIPQIRRLMDLKSTAERKLPALEEALKRCNHEREQALKETKRQADQTSALKLWENWGHRVYRLVHTSTPIELTGKDLRLVLEEAIIASASQRAVVSRIQILRDEKLILLKFDRRLLTGQQPLRATCRPLIAVVLFARRLQKLTGHQALKLPAEEEESTVQFPSTRKRTRSRSSQRTSASQLGKWQIN
jgi:hypothetical protein